MTTRQPEEAQGFKLLGHDRSAAWGGGSIVEVHKGYAYVRVVGDHHLYVNSERLVGDKGKNARAGLFIYDISKPDEPREVGFYDTPGSGPHRFGVDNKRGLAFLPNDAPGWNKRVIWTLDIRDPLKPEVVSIWGLPWQKAED